jgi:hypothetical protein
MTYGRVHSAGHTNNLADAAVCHLAELVRGHFLYRSQKDRLIRTVSPKASLRLDGAPSPQGEKGPHGRLLRQAIHSCRLNPSSC